MSAALYDAARHEMLIDRAWDAGAARAAIQKIVGDTEAAFTPAALWPIHPHDEPGAATAFHCLYFGAAGVIWALDYLARVGASARRVDFGPHIAGLLEPNRTQMGAHEKRLQSLLMGDAGIWLTEYRNAPTPERADALSGAVAANFDHPALELMWGAPGTMLVALAMHAQTDEARWLDAYRASADALDRAFTLDEARGFHVWTQNLYGNRRIMLGAVHGFAGNAYALIRGRDVLPADQWRRLSHAMAETFAATATRSDAGVNWAPAIGAPRQSGDKILVQHCHGAPGMVVCLAELPEPIDDLLLAGGETTWRAGPLTKGANLCHGTGGNGYAFLKLFARTGDQKWLDRARAFAMHAIAQSEADAAQFGMRRYSLWTGDLGFAVYLWDCIKAQAAFPTMDVF